MASDFGVPITNHGDFYFISYNTEDAERVAPIVRFLYENGVPVWYDKGIDYGNLWEEVITEHIEKSKAVILFFSKGILEKENSYVLTEYEAAKDYFDKPIHVIFLDEIDKKSVPRKYVPWMIALGKLQNLHMAKFDDSDQFKHELQKLVGYQEISNKTEESKKQTRISEISAAKIGSTVKLGKYYINNDRLKEDIEWIVLDKTPEKALLISKYVLNSRTYHEENCDITWEKCTLRKWLNGEFIEAAFEEEKDALMITHLKNDQRNNKVPGGKDTYDSVFCLSSEEAKRYFISDEARMAYSTAYAQSQGAFPGVKGGCAWWLRSPGSFRNFASSVSDHGSVYSTIVHISYHSVRPALWVSLEPTNANRDDKVYLIQKLLRVLNTLSSSLADSSTFPAERR